jgi:8-oxo-dGTP pyrophosphatase MutT (NUDIX family)
MLEETGVSVEVGELLEHRVHEYDALTVDFNAYRARIAAGELRAIHVADFRWVSVAEMADHCFPPADEDAIALLAGTAGETS